MINRVQASRSLKILIRECIMARNTSAWWASHPSPEGSPSNRTSMRASRPWLVRMRRIIDPGLALDMIPSQGTAGYAPFRMSTGFTYHLRFHPSNIVLQKQNECLSPRCFRHDTSAPIHELQALTCQNVTPKRPSSHFWPDTGERQSSQSFSCFPTPSWVC